METIEKQIYELVESSNGFTTDQPCVTEGKRSFNLWVEGWKPRLFDNRTNIPFIDHIKNRLGTGRLVINTEFGIRELPSGTIAVRMCVI